MTPEAYMDLKAQVIARGYAHDIDWAESVKRPQTAIDLWINYTWVVLCSGMKEQVVRPIQHKIEAAIAGGQSSFTVFRHRGKAMAIDFMWTMRDKEFKIFNQTPDDQLVEWCDDLPWIGPITKWHLAKNLGIDCAKPDRHLVRIAGAEGTFALCQRLAQATGDRVATVDVVIWRAANLGLI